MAKSETKQTKRSNPCHCDEPKTGKTTKSRDCGCEKGKETKNCK